MKRLEKLNELVARYGGLFANWRSSGGKGRIPPELVEKMDEINAELTKVLGELK